MGYYIGDIPATDLVIDPLRHGPDGEMPVDLDPFTTVEVDLYDPNGEQVLTAGFAAAIAEELIVVEWPASSPFEVAGIYSLRPTLRNDGAGHLERLPAVYLVADIEDGWHTLDSARDIWPDAPGYDSWLYELLDIAKQQVLDYAPALAEGVRPPKNYRLAQRMQARNLWNANKVDPASGGIGEDSFVVQPFPLDWMVKQVIRPKTAVPVVG